ncbi:ABC transporter ATP-binding protein [Streptococcus sp. H49]|uniref:ABC transporter ATP-binding protein n=1 Tax=Streptococcus huangxiaojuni TaxID=3237239 RepID=UPI0034A370D5
MLSIFKRFFGFCSNEDRRKLYLSLFLGVLKAFAVALRIPAIALVLRDITNHQLSLTTLWTVSLIMSASLLFNLLLTLKITMLQTEAGYHSCAQKRIEIAEHIRYLPMGYFNSHSLGRIASITTNTLETLSDIATRVVMVTSQGFLTVFAIIFFVLLFDWRIGLVLCAGFCLFLIPNTLMRRSVSGAALDKQKADTEIVDTVLEYVQGIVEIKNYHLNKNSVQKLVQAIRDKEKADTAMTIRTVPWMTVQRAVTKTTGVVMSLLSIWFYLHDSMDLLTCMMMVISSFMVYENLDSVSSFSSLLRSVDIAVELVQGILDLEPMDISGRDLPVQKTDIRLRNVDFSYGGRKIIDNLSLDIPEQTTTAIVGPSGSGKTTLCNLMARFWDTESGSVSLGGINVKDYSYDSLIRHFSFVFQNVYLFEDTIENNIKFGKPQASDEEMIAAAKKAACHDFIMSLPDGYQTKIGEGGASLSGGEKQRLSIARALLKDAPIIILDEATANVDPESEEELLQAVSQLTADKTVIMIAHRLKTVEQADQIIVLDRGKIVQQGKHADLMQREGLYADFIRTRKQALSWRLTNA